GPAPRRSCSRDGGAGHSGKGQIRGESGTARGNLVQRPADRSLRTYQGGTSCDARSERAVPYGRARRQVHGRGVETYWQGRLEAYRLTFAARRYECLQAGCVRNELGRGPGATQDVIADDGNIYDTDRIMFLRAYLTQLQRAAADGVPVKGCFQWSSMDNFE